MHFYSFIQLFVNKRIEYKVGSNTKVLAIFMNKNKGALIRLFDYSQLKTKLGEASTKRVGIPEPIPERD